MKTYIISHTGFICGIVLSLNIGGLSVHAQNDSSKDTINGKKLKEVVVKGKQIKHEGMKDIMFLNRQNREFGSNALDAISSLPLLTTTLDDDKLTSRDGQSVFILINGIPSDGLNLRTYQADDIAKVEYYQFAPAEYMTFTQGPVANIILKKRTNRLYSAYLSSRNHLNRTHTTDQINLTYADSLNQVKANYYIMAANTPIKSSDRIRYQDGSSSDYATQGARNKFNEQKVWASYQRFQGKNLFNIEAGYYWNPSSRDISPGQITIKEPSGDQYSGGAYDMLSNRSSRLYANLYYAYSFSPASKLAINVVNTFGYAGSHNIIRRDVDEMPSMTYEIENSVDNHIYSLIAYAYYYMPLLRGFFSSGLNWTYTTMTQETENSKFYPKTNSGLAFAGWQRTFGVFSFMPTVGAQLQIQDNGSVSTSYMSPYAQISFRAMGKGKLSGLSASLSLRAMQISPSVGNLAPNPTNITDKLISIGNSGLKRMLNLGANLNLTYHLPKGNNIMLIYKPNFYKKQIMPILYQDNEVTYIQSINGSNYNSHNIDLTFTLKPFKWLSISPNVAYSHVNYHTPTTRVNEGRWYYSGGIFATFPHWDFGAYTNCHTKSYEGDFIIRGAGQHGAYVNWKYKGFTASIRYHYMQYSVIDRFGKLNNFQYRHTRDFTKNDITLTLTYFISKGKTRRHDDKIINNSDNTTGLSDYNSTRN